MEPSLQNSSILNRRNILHNSFNPGHSIKSVIVAMVILSITKSTNPFDIFLLLA